jgi:hypothetical protein
MSVLLVGAELHGGRKPAIGGGPATAARRGDPALLGLGHQVALGHQPGRQKRDASGGRVSGGSGERVSSGKTTFTNRIH